MPRTAIAISTVARYFEGISGGVVSVAGDAANDHSVDISADVPHLGVIAINTGVGAKTFTIDLPASVKTYNVSTTKTITVPAAVAGAPGVNFIPMNDYHALNQGGSLANITSTDLASIFFVAVRWSAPPSP